jgi:hypothetical protein
VSAYHGVDRLYAASVLPWLCCSSSRHIQQLALHGSSTIVASLSVASVFVAADYLVIVLYTVIGTSWHVLGAQCCVLWTWLSQHLSLSASLFPCLFFICILSCCSVVQSGVCRASGAFHLCSYVQHYHCATRPALVSYCRSSYMYCYVRTCLWQLAGCAVGCATCALGIFFSCQDSCVMCAHGMQPFCGAKG